LTISVLNNKVSFSIIALQLNDNKSDNNSIVEALKHCFYTRRYR